MAVIQEYYSSRFDPGAPALTSFLAGFMETRRELNMMRIKAELASADPRSLMALQRAALQEIADLNKLKGQIAAADQKQRNDITVELIRAGSRERVAEIGAESRVAAARVSAKANLIRSARAAATYANKQTEEGLVAGNTQAAVAEGEATKRFTTVESAVTAITSTVDSGMDKLGGTRMSPRTREAAQFTIASRAYNAAKTQQDPATLKALRDRFFQGKEPEAYAAEKFRVESEEEIQDRLGNVKLGGLSRARLESGQPLSATEQRALIRGSKLPDGRTVEQAIGGVAVVESTPDEVLTAAAAEEAPGVALPPGVAVAAGAGRPSEIEDALKKAEARYAALEKRALQGKGLTEVLFDRANPLYGLPGRRPRAVREAAIEEVVAEEAPAAPAAPTSATPTAPTTPAAEETAAVVASMPETPIKSKGMVLPEPAGVPEEAPVLGAYERKIPLPETGVLGTAGLAYTGELDTGDRVLGAKTPRPARFEIPRFAAPDARRPTTDEELLRDAAAEKAAAEKAADSILRAQLAFAEKQRAVFPVGQQLARFGEALGENDELFGSAVDQIELENDNIAMNSMPVRRK